jgi:peptidyl-prolyl cis-trans isomerase-like protein 2
LSLQPFTTPVCTPDGLIFDHENIIRWLLKHDTNPVNGRPLKQSDLIKLVFGKNDSGEYVDPVTYKVLTDNTHIIAVRHGDIANTFAYDTVERLNFKPKMWKDLVSDEEFSRKDVITLQDPQNLESRNLSSFQYIKDGEDAGIEKESASINNAALGSSGNLKIMKAKEAVARARAEREAASNIAMTKAKTNGETISKTPVPVQKFRATPFNASHHTSGLAAASFTSTGVTPHTSAELQLLSDEEFILRRGRVKQKGYVSLTTTHGKLLLELLPEHAPKAVWNFVRLVQKGYYNGITFHRNIRNFMIQGGDPTGTGKGGQSIWGKNFEDEFDGPLKNDARGILSMANKGKDTNSSQFFILYRPAAHLDRKHTVFGRVVEDTVKVLDTLENVPVNPKDNRPKEPIKMLEATVLSDPFAEFWAQKKAAEDAEKAKEQRRKEDKGDERTTWTGKRVRADGTVQEDGAGGVAKYLKAALAKQTHAEVDEIVEEIIEEDLPFEPVRKKAKAKASGGGGFGNFDSW